MMETQTIDRLKGLNEDTELGSGYLSACENVFCLPDGGISTLRGRVKFINESMGAGLYLYEKVWPDGHKSIIIRAGRDIYAYEAGHSTKLNQPMAGAETCSTVLSHPNIDDNVTHWSSAKAWFTYIDNHDPDTPADGIITSSDMVAVDGWYADGQITKEERELALACARYNQGEQGTTIEDFLSAWLPPEFTVRELLEMFNDGQDHIDKVKVENYWNYGFLTSEEYNRLISVTTADDQGEQTITSYCANISLSTVQYNDWFPANRQNPTHITSYSKGRYIIGADHRRSKPFWWDGRVDRPIKEISTGGYTYRVVEAFTDRIFAIGNPDFPLNVFYGDPDQLNIQPGYFITLRDNPRTSRLVGMRTADRNTMYVWGDYGLWAIEYTGQYPLFALPTLIHKEANCESNNSIVEIPGVGYAWMGKNGPWLLSGGQAKPIPGAYERMKRLLNKMSRPDLYRVSGFYDETRKTVVWSFPTQVCGADYPWRSPRAIAWDWSIDSFTELGMGFEGSCSIDYLGKRQRIVTDQDGYVYLYDYSENEDKEAIIPWSATIGWLGSGNLKTKWKSLRLNRPMKGADKVYVSIYDESESGAVNTGANYFSIAETFDVPSASTDGTIAHPSYDPGGPHDLGVPPNPTVDMEAPILIVSRYIKIVLHNNNGAIAGPNIPMRRLEITSQPLK